jgi:AraC-like DNA-binding protein
MGVYRELAPPPGLDGLLACLWVRSVEPGEPAQAVRVLPDACVDIVWAAGEGVMVAGPDTGPVLSRRPPGSLSVGARFRPGRAPLLLGQAASDLRDVRPPLAALWGDRAARRIAESDAAGSAPAMLAHLAAELAARAADTPRPEPWTEAVVRWAAAAAPGRLGRLCADLDVGERQARRRVEERFGYGPAVLRRVLRLQRLLRLAGRHEWPLAELAAAAGYADQAHMTRECRRLAGLTPVSLLAGRRAPSAG